MHKSTIARYEQIVALYDKLLKEEGERAAHLDRSYFYGKIEEQLGVCEKTIARALRHGRKSQIVR